MIALGDLDSRLVFVRDVETGRSALNEPEFQSETWLKAKGRRRDLSDKEQINAGRETAATVSRFILFSRAKTRLITAKDRFACDGQTWEVSGVKQLDQGRNRFLELTAVSLDA